MTDFYKLARTESLVRPIEQKYGADHGQRISVEDIVARLEERIRAGALNNELADFLDEVFLYGCWKELVERLPMGDGHLFLRDVRGLIVAAARRCVAAREEKK